MVMLRIGIITVHRTIGNYGASLQCFALWKYLDSHGFDCEVIDLLRSEHSKYIESEKYRWPQKKRSIIRQIASFIKWKIIFGNCKTVEIHTYSKIRIHKFNNFNDKIKYSKQYQSIDQLYDNPPLYDVYLTGSDQVWNPNIGFYNEPYFLTFASNNSRKVSYASSIALTALPNEYHELYKKWLSEYEKISVRETEAKTIIENLINKEVSVVIDPTFLIDIVKWKEWAIYPKRGEKYMFVYTLVDNEPLISYASKKAKAMGLDIYLAMSTSSSLTYDDNVNFLDDLGPLEWIGIIKDAAAFVTDSFHGTAFSIMLGTPFYVFISLSSRGSRIRNLLETFSLSNHCLSPDFNENGSMEFDYERIIEILNKERLFSEEFLYNAIINECN